MKKELLVPVGNIECLQQAVLNGADAIYLGGKKFGARAYADNFTDEELTASVKFAHLYGVKVYVTVNTLIHESELESAYQYCLFLASIGVDALIIQDIGLISLLHTRIPDLEIHASTQVHNTNEYTLKLLEDLGVKRVVFAREMSLDEIEKIDTKLEKEVFIHGALCISYSGECLFSSILMNRSGNRGECAQICRLPFKIKENEKFIKTNGEYLLSTKELNTSKYFNEIMSSNILSLKIEGRMKSPTYVACVTKMYRNLIDSYYNLCEKTNEFENDLEIIFNRKYTKGFLFNANNEEIINIKTSNHLGKRIGKVINIDKKHIYIKLEYSISQGDGIRINDEGLIVNYLYNDRKLLINQASDIALIDNKIKCHIGDDVLLTSSSDLIKKYQKLGNKKIPVDVEFITNGDIATLKINDGINEVIKTSNIVSKSINIKIDENSILKQLSKLGNTPFILNKSEINIDDNIFINIKDLNELRRKAIDELISIRENNVVNYKIYDNKYPKDIDYIDKLNISILVRNESQLKQCLSYFDRIYVVDKNLYEKYQDNDKVYYRTSRIFENIEYKNTLCTDLGSIYKNRGIGDYYLNITNHETINYLNKYNKINTLSVELNDQEINSIMDYYHNKCNLEILIYSRIELMITKYCPVNYLVNKDKYCNKCLNNKYELVDRFNKCYPIINDIDKHLTHILDNKVTNKLDLFEYYYNLGIRNFRIELLDESEDEINNIIKIIEQKKEQIG